MTKPTSNAPAGGLPYHPDEFGANSPQTVFQYSGALGVLFLLYQILVNAMTALVCIPFVLLGVAEFVSHSPTSWRVRWIRRD